MYKKPSSSTDPKSPVLSQPSVVKAFAVAAVKLLSKRLTVPKIKTRTRLAPILLHNIGAPPYGKCYNQPFVALIHVYSQPYFATLSYRYNCVVMYDHHVINWRREAAVRWIEYLVSDMAKIEHYQRA